MDWTQAITITVSILVPMLCGFGWLIRRMDAGVRNIRKDMDAGFKNVRSEFREVHLELKVHGERVARIEGMLSPYEPKVKEKK